jgi:hypothetical protein
MHHHWIIKEEVGFRPIDGMVQVELLHRASNFEGPDQ